MNKAKKSLCISLIIYSIFCFNHVKAEVFDEYDNSMKKAWSEINNYNYVKASGYANNAEILYKKTLREFSVKADSEKLWKWNLSQQINLINLFNELSDRFKGQGDFLKQLHWADKAISINPWIPYSYLIKSRAYKSMGRPWKAATSCYEAKRLNRFEQKRKIIDFFNSERTYETSPSKINDECDSILKSLNKPIEYPLNLDLPSGKSNKGLVLNGMGANILTLNYNWVNIYLGQNIDELIASGEFPVQDIAKKEDTYSSLDAENSSIFFDDKSRYVMKICLFSKEFRLRTNYGDFRVGDHATSPLKKIGDQWGFYRANSDSNNFREYFIYPEVGISIIISSDDSIGVMCIDQTDNLKLEYPIKILSKEKSSADMTASSSENFEISPDNSEEYSDSGAKFRALKQFEKAISEYSKAIEIDPSNVYAYRSRGDSYYDLKQFEKAISDYSKAIEIDPSDIYSYQFRGGSYKHLKQFEKAIADYSKAIEIDPSSIYSYQFRAGSYYDLKQFEKAIADYSKAIELDPSDIYSYQSRGDLYNHLKQFEKAIADYRKAITLDPNDPVANGNIGWLYLLNGQYKLSIDFSKTGLLLDPEAYGINNNLILGLLLNDQYNEAEIIADNFLKLALENKQISIDKIKLRVLIDKIKLLKQQGVDHPNFDRFEIKYRKNG